MHEMSIAQGIMDIALDVANKHEAKQIKNIVLDIGILSGIEVQALEFSFEVISRDTLAQGAKLVINNIPLRAKCLDCDHEFAADNYIFRCPKCQSILIDIKSGRELQVKSVDIE